MLYLRILFTAFSILIAFFMVLELVNRVRFERHCSFTMGHIIGSATMRATGGGSAGTPIIEFVASDGQRYEFTHTIGYAFYRPKIGKSVRVAYDPHKPQKAYLYTNQVFFYGPTIGTLLGTLLVAGYIWMQPLVRH